VVTAGPTREHLDDVRFLSNASTGRMGWEIAALAARRGARVTLVLGPTHLPDAPGTETVRVVTTEDLLRATRAAAEGADLVVFAAAPADWRPATRRKGKPPREAGDAMLWLKPTVDVAAALGVTKGSRTHVGFALEVTVEGERRAREKLRRKQLDAVVLNGPENFGEGGGDVSWIPASGEASALPGGSKRALARAILDRATALVRATALHRAAEVSAPGPSRGGRTRASGPAARRATRGR
jgi:phosphopantothenoylcysteine decarboxylase/phosphopantothenate--cysteine ligase